jgi:hypothetical protein
MIQMIYENKLHMAGKFRDIIYQLRHLSLEYKTVKELIESKTARL